MRINKTTEEWKQKNKKSCIDDIRTCLDNPFINHADKIKDICYLHNVDIGVGLDIYINENYTNDERLNIGSAYIREYIYLCRKYYLDFIVECLEEVKKNV